MLHQRHRHLTVRVPLERGRCRWCRCTETHACDSGCSWADAAMTLCSECVAFDRLIRTGTGRASLREACRDAAPIPQMSERARPSARR